MARRTLRRATDGRLCLRALRTAARHPDAFDPADVAYFLRIAENCSDYMDRKGIEYIRRDEADERRQDPTRTADDEQRRVATVTRLLAEFQALRKDLAAKRAG